ncbi:DUF6545 domain-containing protein [Streptomyces radicis]|uniref:DUF6545 domain-containing protein n=1 Tax=Streptomyces radicis TaxID=1750517 RepID=UPI0011C40E71|nr:DUF6545 domain-containing protein [Streptomyces radicis]
MLALAYWAGHLVHLYVRIPDVLPWLAVIINVPGACRALTLLVPTATGAVRIVQQARLVRVLWPLWRDLSAAVPTVVLAAPRPTRLRQLLGPRGSLALRGIGRPSRSMTPFSHCKRISLRTAHGRAPLGVRALAVRPGFTHTGAPHIDTIPDWIRLSVDQVVDQAMKDLRRRRPRSVAGRHFKLYATAVHHAPRRLAARMARSRTPKN